MFEAEARASDIVIVSRPNNARRACDLFARLAPEERPRLVYDAEALYHRRLLRQAQLAPEGEARVLQAQASSWLEAEAAIATCADEIICVSDDEAAFFRAHGARHVRVVTPWLMRAGATDATLTGRADIGFVAGWLAGASSPNGDALEWFATEVMPHVLSEIPWARVRVTGTLPRTPAAPRGPAPQSGGVRGRPRRLLSSTARCGGTASVWRGREAEDGGGAAVWRARRGDVGRRRGTGVAPGRRDRRTRRPGRFRGRGRGSPARCHDVWRAHRAAIDAAMAAIPSEADWAALLCGSIPEGTDVGHAV